MTGDIDDEFAEVIDTVGTRRRQRILHAAMQVASDIRADAELLGTAAVSGTNREHSPGLWKRTEFGLREPAGEAPGDGVR